MTGVAGVVLAAGRASRYRAAGGPEPTKLVATLDAEPLVRHVARAALDAGLRPVVVVTGHARAEVEAALVGLPVERVHNADFAAGLSTSLRRGLAALPAGTAGALILLGDMPRVAVPTLRALADAAGDADAAVLVWRGERGNPVLLGRSLFARAAGLAGDQGARRLLRDPALRVVEVTVEDPAVRLDIDEPRDLNSS